MNTTERECLDAAAAGDRQAFDVLCRMYRQELIALCMRFVRDSEDAQDVVQETFARAWQHLATFRSEASFRTWLWEIGRNLCLNHLRARKSRLSQKTAPIESLSEADRRQALDTPDTRPTPEETAVDSAHVAQIRQAIAQCAADKRWESTDWELFLMRIERDISYAEFAERHGRNEAYWRNRWRDKVKPVLERVRVKIDKLSE